MIDLQAGYRPARPDDALAMAERVEMAGEGLPVHLWTRMASAGQPPRDVGQERARRTRYAVPIRAGPATTQP